MTKAEMFETIAELSLLYELRPSLTESQKKVLDRIKFKVTEYERQD